MSVSSPRHRDFVDLLFDSRDRYLSIIEEFFRGDAAPLWNDALSKYESLVGEINDRTAAQPYLARDLYALVRSKEPSTLIETGVCNGLSTTALLLGLYMNGGGTLYSVDNPIRADDRLASYDEDTVAENGGAVLPADKNPGWIIPDELRDRWKLRLGRSQRELPQLLSEVGTIELFFHDSDHSHACLMFEFELAYEWLEDGGVIVSDDIDTNRAFDMYVHSRDVTGNRLTDNIGYMVKDG